MEAARTRSGNGPNSLKKRPRISTIALCSGNSRRKSWTPSPQAGWPISPSFPDHFNQSVDGRLLYVRTIHIDQYAQVAGVDTPEKTTTLLDAPFSAWRVGIPKIRDAIDAKPLITRKTQDGRDYLVIQNGRLDSGRYADDLSLLIAIGLKKPGEWPKGPPAVKQVIAMLELPWQERLSDKSLDEAAASLKPAADEAIDEIMRAFNRSGQTFAYRHRAVQILQRLNTEKARAALLDVALGHSAEDLPSMKQWASAAYIRTTQDPANVRKLLVSDDAGVLGNALRAIKGVKIDESLLKRLVELTAYKGDKEPMFQESVRLAAAAVMAGDSSGKFATQKVDAILAAVGQVANLPHANKTHWPGSYTYAESSYQRYMNCLSEMPGPTKPYVRPRRVRLPSLADLLVIARANAATPPPTTICFASSTISKQECTGPGQCEVWQRSAGRPTCRC